MIKSAELLQTVPPHSRNSVGEAARRIFQTSVKDADRVGFPLLVPFTVLSVAAAMIQEEDERREQED